MRELTPKVSRAVKFAWRNMIWKQSRSRSGAEYCRLEVEGCKRFEGKGVYRNAGKPKREAEHQGGQRVRFLFSLMVSFCEVLQCSLNCDFLRITTSDRYLYFVFSSLSAARP